MANSIPQLAPYARCTMSPFALMWPSPIHSDNASRQHWAQRPPRCRQSSHLLLANPRVQWILDGDRANIVYRPGYVGLVSDHGVRRPVGHGRAESGQW